LEHTNEHRCLLGTIRKDGEKGKICTFAGTSKCNNHCDFFIALHGKSGETGRSGASEIPLEYRQTTIQNSVVRTEQPEAYELLDVYENSMVKIFSQTPDPKTRVKNLYLWSKESGTGKSVTASAVLNSFLARYYLGTKKRDLQAKQTPIYFLDLNKFQTLFNQMTRAGIPTHVREVASEKYYEQMDFAKRAVMTVLDDVGTRSVTEALRGDILDIVNERMNNYRPTIFTSNLALQELPALFGEQRLFDRIKCLNFGGRI
jgi:DNA replication protein DnaC